MTSGYYGDADATAAAVTEDGWLRTGDLARMGPFGTVLFEGRAKDVIKVGGYSVYALEVERAIEEHPDVLEAAVVGCPTSARAGPGAPSCACATGPTSTPTRCRPSPPSAWPSTRCRAAGWPSTSCPAPARTRSRSRELVDLFD